MNNKEIKEEVKRLGIHANNSRFTFLTRREIFGDNRLKILEDYGTKCAITDFAILLGGNVSDVCHTSEGNTLKDRTCDWWIQTLKHDQVEYRNPNAYRYSEYYRYSDDYRRRHRESDETCIYSSNYGTYIVNKYGDESSYGFILATDVGARPATSYSEFSSIFSNKVRGTNGILEVEYGEYPQTIVGETYSSYLERAYNNGNLKSTGKKYTTAARRIDYWGEAIPLREHTEYEYNGNKYIRFVGDANGAGKILSDGRKIQSGNVYWVRVEPIIWLVDEKANIALSKKILFSGVPFYNTMYYRGEFEHTDIYRFMSNYFSKEIEKIEPTYSQNNCSKDDLMKKPDTKKTLMQRILKKH